MKRGLHKKVLAGLMSFALAVPSGSFIQTGSQKVLAAEEDNTVLDKILGADDISLRMKWNDKSNIGEEHSIALSSGSITVKDNGTMRKELTAQQLARTEMGLGINLGNTMDATHAVETKASLVKNDYDTGWGQPVTTREYINCLHSYGINTIRIPIAWSNGDIDDGTYTIRSEMFDRIEEVVNYALDNGMYVIINDHWDNQWWGQFGACKKDEDGNKVVDEETRTAAWTRYERYWTQICERFKKYSDHLIFEGANEELGTRLNDAICLNGPAKGYNKPDNAGADIQTMGGNLTTDELYDTANRINQKFVDIVRASGGNNTNRHLLIAGYDTDIDKTIDDRFKMPSDIQENGKDKLFLSVHYYTPWAFCGDHQSGTYTVKDQKETEANFQKLQKFTNEGYAVIIGECGVCEPSSVTGSVTQWYNDTFTESLKNYAVPVMWENGNLFDRVEPSIFYKDIAIMLNTINGSDGDTSADRNTGGEAPGPGGEVQIPDYIDSTLWKTPGIHAYLTYQTSTWDYRNSYKPLKNLGNNEHSWEYLQAYGSEVTTNTKVTDVQVTKDGEYKVSVEEIDLSSANSFNSIGIATDINKELYPGITVTDAKLIIDGVAVTADSFNLSEESDDTYYKFMFVNKWGTNNYPLTEINENDKLKGPSKSMEITFKINGLEKALSDIESGEYINPETGLKISETEESTKIPDYLDSNLWKTPGIHAYINYQTSTWDYRNEYKPQKDLDGNGHSWEYLQASGSEITTDTKVTDVQITKNGEYKVLIEGIDLSAANYYNVLGIATDIKRELYPGVTVTDAVLKVDGKAVTETSVNPVAGNNDDYYRFLLVNKWDGEGNYPLSEINNNEKLAVPSKSIEITFKINGLEKAFSDMANGEYINPETGEKIPAPVTPGPANTPSSAPSDGPVIPLYPPYVNTSQPQGGGQTPSGSAAPGTSTAPSGSTVPGASAAPSESTVPGNSAVPSGSAAPGTSTVPAGTQAPGTTTETKKDDVTGAVTEITTTADGNVSKVIEKTTMPDGTQTIKETVSEDINGIITIKETLNSNKSNATLVKNTTKYTDGDIISTDATLYTGNSDIDSNYSARNVIPESFLNEAKEAGINNVTLYIEKNIVDNVKDNQGKRMVIKIEVPETEGISIGKVMLSKEAVQGAKESSRRFVVKMVNKNPSKSYTVTIPPSELAKMQGDIDISIKSGKVAEKGGDKQKNIENILSANGLEAEDAVIVSIASNNIKGGIKASAPVVTQSVKAGSTAYVYHYNSNTGKLEEIANSKRTVLKNGMTGIEGYPGNDYVVTSKELTGKNVVTLLSQSKVIFNKTSLKKGSKTKLNITLPSELEIKESLKKEASYAKQAVVVTYKTSNAKIVKVSKDGTIKAAVKGKAKVTVQIRLADGKVKTVKKTITVK